MRRAATGKACRPTLRIISSGRQVTAECGKVTAVWSIEGSGSVATCMTDRASIAQSSRNGVTLAQRERLASDLKVARLLGRSSRSKTVGSATRLAGADTDDLEADFVAVDAHDLDEDDEA